MTDGAAPSTHSGPRARPAAYRTAEILHPSVKRWFGGQAGPPGNGRYGSQAAIFNPAEPSPYSAAPTFGTYGLLVKCSALPASANFSPAAFSAPSGTRSSGT